MRLNQLLLSTSAAGANLTPAGVLAEQLRRLAEPGLAEKARG